MNIEQHQEKIAKLNDQLQTHLDLSLTESRCLKQENLSLKSSLIGLERRYQETKDQLASFEKLVEDLKTINSQKEQALEREMGNKSVSSTVLFRGINNVLRS